VDVLYAAHSRAGLFEGPGDHYGEIWYELDGRKTMSRSTTEPIVLDTLYRLGKVQPPARSEEFQYSGHPLPAYPQGAALIYFALWPATVGLAWCLRLRSRN
jgi:hypothetical protein